MANKTSRRGLTGKELRTGGTLVLALLASAVKAGWRPEALHLLHDFRTAGSPALPSLEAFLCSPTWGEA